MGTHLKFGGIYTPEQVDKLREELKRGDRPDESANEREERAIEILNRRNIERVSGDARIRTMRSQPPSKGDMSGAAPLTTDRHRFQ